jgi:hypothetical protein
MELRWLAGLWGILWLCPLESLLLSPISARSQSVIAQPEPIAATTCQFAPPPTPLRSTTQYGIFGNDEFDTLVCGYLVTRPEQRFDETVNLAYLRILQFQDEAFKQAIASGVENKNTINTKTDNYYELGLGCYRNGKIIGTEHDRTVPYLSQPTQQQLLQSSAQKPLRLILSFGKHTGSSCDCCNLPHRIRTY